MADDEPKKSIARHVEVLAPTSDEKDEGMGVARSMAMSLQQRISTYAAKRAIEAETAFHEAMADNHEAQANRMRSQADLTAAVARVQPTSLKKIVEAEQTAVETDLINSQVALAEAQAKLRQLKHGAELDEVVSRREIDEANQEPPKPKRPMSRAEREAMAAKRAEKEEEELRAQLRAEMETGAVGRHMRIWLEEEAKILAQYPDGNVPENILENIKNGRERARKRDLLIK